MYLTTKSVAGYKRRVDQHDEMEVLLESYIDLIDQMSGDVMHLQHSMVATDEYLNIHLDSVRNKIMKLNLLLTIGTLSTALSGVAASIFGMNLTSHLENNPQAFLIVSSGIFLGNSIIFTLCYLYAKSRRLW